ncbi:lipopolysaccharide core heptosyltransferase RfaQ [Geobacter sp. OR-1]|nr:lipopolysaccharide core heptosyltransferase RfaQ [Geobacter sp. OR-1]
MTSPAKLRPPANILLIQLGDIGDVVLTTPTIRALKESYPDARVSIMVRKPFGTLLAGDPHLHEVVESIKPRGKLFKVMGEYLGFAGRLRRARYDLAIDLRTGDRGAFLSFITGAAERVGRRVGEQWSWHDLMFTRVLPESLPAGPAGVHPGADQSLRIIRELGIDTPDSLPRLYVAPHDREQGVALLAKAGLAPGGRMVTLNPFSRWAYKEWDSGKWRAVIEWLWDQHQLPSVIIGSPEEAAAAEAIINGLEGRAFSLAGKTTLGELTAVISLSSLHIGVDSAAPHMAAALGIATATIHGPSDWRDWRLSDDRHRIITPATECVPCHGMGCDDSRKSRCLEELSVAEVIADIDRILLMQRDSGGQAT